MICKVLFPTAAAPLLHLTWAKVARTPLARLGIGFHIVPRTSCHDACDCTPQKCCPPAAELPPKIPEKHCAFGNLVYLRPLGMSFYIDRLLAGGLDGEILPLALSRCRTVDPPGDIIGEKIDFIA